MVLSCSTGTRSADEAIADHSLTSTPSLVDVAVVCRSLATAVIQTASQLLAEMHAAFVKRPEDRCRARETQRFDQSATLPAAATLSHIIGSPR